MTDASSASAPALPRLNTIPKFLDLSHYDDLQDIAKVKAAGILGIINKVTEGPGVTDETFAIRKPVVLGAGLKYGAYHFLRRGDQVAMAKRFLARMGDPTGLEMAADWEDMNVPVDQIKVWLSTVHALTGRWPIVYSYAAMLQQALGHLASDPVLSQCKLWLAAYNSHPSWPKQIWPMPWGWQFTGDGNGPGPHQIPGVVLRGARGQASGIDIDSATALDDVAFLASWAA